MKVKEMIGIAGAHYAWIWWCPGCDAPHQCDDRWAFNGNVDAPTFGPQPGSTSSVLVHEVRDDKGNVIRPRCHSQVTDGNVFYYTDSGHSLAGKTVPMPDWPYRPGTYGGVKD